MAGGICSLIDAPCLSRRSESSLEKLGHVENTLRALALPPDYFFRLFKNIFYNTKINVNESALLTANNSISI